jgi:actin-related protein
MMTHSSYSQDTQARMLTVLFEQLQVPSVCLYQRAPLNLYTEGLTAGYVLQSGAGITQCTPVHEV